MMVRFVAGVLCFCAVAYAQKLHDYMTDDEIYTVFQVPRHEVPDYEIIPIYHSVHKRSADSNETVGKITMKMPDETLELYLEPTDGILASVNTPVYLAKPNANMPNGVEYTPVENALKDLRIYQNTAATLSFTYMNNVGNFALTNEGVINGSTIRGFPSRLRRDSDFLASFLGDDYSDTVQPHVLFKLQNPQNSVDTPFFNRVRRSAVSIDYDDSSSTTVPDVVYPEILLVMDYNLFKTQNENVGHALLYLLSFWNAVDLRYRSMTNPEVRLNIAGIIISTELGGAPYLEDYILDSVDGFSEKASVRQLDADKSLQSMSKYFYKEDRLPEHDLTMAMTRLDLCNMVDSPFFNDFCDSTTIGYAYEFGACNRSSIDENTEAVGIVEDNGGYSGIIPATHEVAHLFGVSHDAGDCADGGYIMSEQLKHTANNFFWSECTKKAFRKFFSSSDGKCLLNKPPGDQPVERILPGEVQTLDEQCQKISGTPACQVGDPCVLLECQVPGKSFCRGIAAAAEGSECGEQKRCINGQCIVVSL